MSFTSFMIEGTQKMPAGLDGYIRRLRVIFFGGTNGLADENRTSIGLVIYDESDQVVRTISILDTSNYLITALWDGKDGSGDLLSPGIYRGIFTWTEPGIAIPVLGTFYISVDSQIANGPYSGSVKVNQDYTDMGGATIHDGIAVPNVRVRAFDSDDNITDEVHSDVDGNFVLYLLPGTYTVVFYKYNFERETSTVVVV